MTKKLLLIAMLLPLSTVSCSTATKSTLLGSAIGLAGGALLGSAVGQNSDHDGQNRAMFVGAAIGGVAGSLIGYGGYKQNEKNESKMVRMEPYRPEPKTPQLTMPQVRRVWVPDRIIDGGDKYESGHYIYILERPSTWSQPND